MINPVSWNLPFGLDIRKTVYSAEAQAGHMKGSVQGGAAEMQSALTLR